MNRTIETPVQHEVSLTVETPKAKKARKTATKTETTRKPSAKLTKAQIAESSAIYSQIGIIATVLASCVLNGYSYSSHCDWRIAAIAGCFIPGLVYLLSRKACDAYRMGRMLKAKAGCVLVLLLLALSIHHCAGSIAILTGATETTQFLSYPLAIAIDAGLVYFEVSELE